MLGVRQVCEAHEAVDVDLFGARVGPQAGGFDERGVGHALQQVCSGPDIEAAGLRPDARAEQLEVAEFKQLAAYLGSLPPGARPA